MIFNSDTLSNFTVPAAAWAVVFLASLWLSLVFWTYRDIRSRSRDPLLRILSVLFALLFFLPGVVLYLVLRPPHTLDDEYRRTLEEEALLQSIDDLPVCPGCGRRTRDPWIVCPTCHTRLKKPCPKCGNLMELAWNLCPYCTAPVPGMRRLDQRPVTSPRQASPDLLSEDTEQQEARLNKYSAP